MSTCRPDNFKPKSVQASPQPDGATTVLHSRDVKFVNMSSVWFTPNVVSSPMAKKLSFDLIRP